MEFSFLADSKLEAELMKWFEKHNHECINIGLATKPLSNHYHIKKVKEKGTLELTVTPVSESNQAEYIFEMRSNRYSSWGPETFDNLSQKFNF